VEVFEEENFVAVGVAHPSIKNGDGRPGGREGEVVPGLVVARVVQLLDEEAVSGRDCGRALKRGDLKTVALVAGAVGVEGRRVIAVGCLPLHLLRPTENAVHVAALQAGSGVKPVE